MAIQSKWLVLAVLCVAAGCRNGQPGASSSGKPQGDAVAAPVVNQFPLVKAIRDEGLPCNVTEWEAYYVLPVALPDRTAQVLTAMQAAPGLSSIRQEFGVSEFLGWSSPLEKVPAPGEPWSELAIAKRHVLAHQQTLRDLHETLSTPCGIRFPNNAAAYPEIRSQSHFEFSAIMRLLRTELAVKAHSQDWKGALEDLTSMLRLHHAWLNVPDTEQFNFGTSEWGLLSESIAFYLSYSPVDEGALASLATELNRFDIEGAAVRALIGTRALAIDNLQNGNVAAIQSLNRTFGGEEVPQFTNGADWFQTHAQDAEQLLGLYSSLIDAAKAGLPEELDKVNRIEQQLERMESDQVATRNNLTFLYGYDAHGCLRRLSIILSLHRAATTAVAVKRYAAKQQKLPEQLSALVSEFITDVPQDPFIPRNIRYRVNSSEFIVYSCFKNRADDMGKVRGNLPLDLGVLVKHPN